MNQCKSVLEHRDKLWGELSESEGNIVATRVGVIAREILGTGRAAETGKRCTDTPRKPAPRLLLQCPLPLITRCSLELEGIKEVLLAHHLAGARLPSASKGSDREVLVREFLSQVFPPQFRFGTGAIVDASKNMTG